MAQRSFPQPTTGVGDGPSGGYSAPAIAEAYAALVTDGILWGLGVTATGGYNVQVAPGQAVVRGEIYTSDAPETLTCTALSSGERRDLVALEGNTTNNNVRLRIITGTPGSGAWPSLTQQATYPNSGIWQIEIARLIVTPGAVSVNAAGPRATMRGLADVADGSITAAKIANGAVTTAKIADGQITAAKIADGAVTAAKIADGAVTTAKIADGQITAAKLEFVRFGVATAPAASGGFAGRADIVLSPAMPRPILGVVATAIIFDQTLTNRAVWAAFAGNNIVYIYNPSAVALTVAYIVWC